MPTQTPQSQIHSALWSEFDRLMMARALRLAKLGQYTARPNPMVGSVLTQGTQIVGEGWHQKAGQPHAEINALSQANDAARGATCYVTLEPCAHQGKTGPCAKALIAAGVKKVIAAMQDPNPQVAGKGFELLKDAGIEVAVGLLEAPAKRLNRGFISRIQRGRPWVTCKLAMSLDGRTALANGTSQWITAAAARADVQKLRARQDAIITGIGTQLADNPSLTVRERDTQPELDAWFAKAAAIGFRQPARILLDRRAEASLDSKIFRPDGDCYWVTEALAGSQAANLPAHIKPLAARPLAELLDKLGAMGMNQVLLESGHRLAGQFLQQGLIDELIVYMAPKLMGDRGMGLFSLDLANMSDVINLELVDMRKMGDDIRLVYNAAQIQGEGES